MRNTRTWVPIFVAFGTATVLVLSGCGHIGNPLGWLHFEENPEPKADVVPSPGYVGMSRAASAATALCGAPGDACGSGHAACCRGNVCGNPSKVCVAVPTVTPRPGSTPRPTSTLRPTPMVRGITRPFLPTEQMLSVRGKKAEAFGWVSRCQGGFRDAEACNTDTDCDGGACKLMTASQTDRDRMMMAAVAVLGGEGLRLVRTVAGIDAPAYKGGLQKIDFILRGVGVDYEMRAMGASRAKREIFDGASWNDPEQGRHYSDVDYANLAIQAALVSDTPSIIPDPANPKRKLTMAEACARVITPGEQDLYDVRIANGRCVIGATFKTPPLGELKDLHWGNVAGLLDGGVPVQKLTPEQEAKLNRTVYCHGATMMGLPGCSTQDALLELDRSATTEVQQHWFFMLRFFGTEDPEWKQEPDVLHMIHVLEHHEMVGWADGLKRQRGAQARCRNNNHRGFHIFRGLRDPNLKMRLCCDDYITSCPVVNYQQLFAMYQAGTLPAPIQPTPEEMAMGH